MTKYAPIWLKDQNGHNYHAKINGKGEYYIVDAGLNKSLVIRKLSDAPVGTVIDYPWFYNSYTVVRNDIFEKLA